ncbi:MAG: fluoride efflux transporter CrcB [Chthoniobacterales bacterium]
MRRYSLVAVGGGLGSLLRFAIGESLAPVTPWSPLATLLINVSGSFVIAFLHFLSDPSGSIYLTPRIRLFLLVGFCGGYTTFSTFSLLCFEAIQHGRWFDALLNILLSHVLCLSGVWLGMMTSEYARAGLIRALRLIRFVFRRESE